MQKNKKEQVHINLSLSKEMLEKIKVLANEKELAYSAMIRLMLQAYLELSKDEQK